MKNTINNLVAILCLIFAVSACNDEKVDDTEQSKPAEITDKRCQKDGENNAEQDGEDTVDCVVIDSKKPDTPDKSDDSKLKGQDLWNKYAPKECYESLSSSGTVRGADVSLTFTSISTRDSHKLTYSGTSAGCVIHSAVQISFKDKPGLSWLKSSCAGEPPVSSSYPLPPSGHENICYQKAEGVSNVKLTTLNGKQVLYAEYPTVNGLTKVWYNLKPFHPIQDYTISPGQADATWTHTNVKINEPIDDKVFVLPKK